MDRSEQLSALQDLYTQLMTDLREHRDILNETPEILHYLTDAKDETKRHLAIKMQGVLPL